MHYTQFRAVHRFVCAGHNETARQKSCCTHCILCQQAVSLFFCDAEPLIAKFYANQKFQTLSATPQLKPTCDNFSDKFHHQ
jgi:hypothetical protein